MAAENVIAFVEARIAAWQAVLASLKSALALDPGGQGGDAIADLQSASGVMNGDTGLPIDLPEGAFNGKSLPACVKLFLSAAKRKKTLKEIAAGLKEGGVESTSDNFEGVIYGALNRLKDKNEVLRFKDGWGLPEWYPANIRAAVPSTGKRVPKKKGKKAKRKESPPNASQESAKTITMPETKPDEKTEPRILAFLAKNAGHELSAADIAKGLGIKIQTAHLVLAKLAHKGKIEKPSAGHFKAIGAVAAS